MLSYFFECVCGEVLYTQSLRDGFQKVTKVCLHVPFVPPLDTAPYTVLTLESPVHPSICTLSSIQHLGPINFHHMVLNTLPTPMRTFSRDCHCWAREVCLSTCAEEDLLTIGTPASVRRIGTNVQASPAAWQSLLGFLMNLARPHLLGQLKHL